MFYLLLIALSFFLFLAFMALTLMEARTGSRLFPVQRARLDQQVERALFIAHHIDWADFISHLVQSIAARVAHDVAQASLTAVRFIERQLTRTVRHLRNRRPNVLAPKPSRESPFAQTNAYIRKTLRLSKKTEE